MYSDGQLTLINKFGIQKMNKLTLLAVMVSATMMSNVSVADVS
ncbi:hypothetical protein AB6G58_12675 [Providencia huaxiensis]